MALVAPSPEDRPLAGVIPTASRLDHALAALGTRMARSRRWIMGVQWAIVAIYAILIVVPTVVPLPGRLDHVWNHVTVFAQFAFWGIWWPGVLLSMILVGRLWCGVLCPEGALTESASRHGLGRALPRWIAWKGWPFVAFVSTTIYGQMISVYQYPGPVLVILGGSTAAAIVVGLIWGRDKRVWCRYLCPVGGVFGLVSKLAPVHFRVDRPTWDRWQKPVGSPMPRVDCAPLVPIRTLESNSPCHMCGRCSGFRDAVTLARRSPNQEIVHVAGRQTNPWETALIVLGLLGVAAGAFRWTSSASYIALKQTLAEALVAIGADWVLDLTLPWWILTDYPEKNDVMTFLDGASLLGFIAGETLLAGIVIGGGLALATLALGSWRSARFHHLAQALIPVAAVGVVLGLSMTTVSLLRADGFRLDFVDALRAAALIGALLWSTRLAGSIAALHTRSNLRRTLATTAMLVPITASGATWATLFWSL